MIMSICCVLQRSCIGDGLNGVGGAKWGTIDSSIRVIFKIQFNW